MLEGDENFTIKTFIFKYFMKAKNFFRIFVVYIISYEF